MTVSMTILGGRVLGLVASIRGIREVELGFGIEAAAGGLLVATIGAAAYKLLSVPLLLLNSTRLPDEAIKAIWDEL